MDPLSKGVGLFNIEDIELKFLNSLASSVSENEQPEESSFGDPQAEGFEVAESVDRAIEDMHLIGRCQSFAFFDFIPAYLKKEIREKA